MQRLILLSACGGAMILNASGALAADTPIRDLPDQGAVNVSGSIEQVKNPREFVLRDDSGSIAIKMPPNQSLTLKQGDNVTVNGSVEKVWFGLLGKDIQASSIQPHKDLTSQISGAIAQATGLSIDQAQVAQVATLPDQGIVQLSGAVDKVNNSKNFVLKDPTGSIDVSVKSDENVALAQGAEVSVVGYVDKGILGKKVDATRVTVLADSTR